MNSFRAPRWCESGNACIYLNCPFRHEVCKHFQAGKCRNQKSMEKPCDGGCMYDHRDKSTLVEFVRNVPLRDYDDIMEKFGKTGITESPLGEQFDISAMAKIDRKLLVRSLKDGGFKFEIRDDEGILDICFVPGVESF